MLSCLEVNIMAPSQKPKIAGDSPGRAAPGVKHEDIVVEIPDEVAMEYVVSPLQPSYTQRCCKLSGLTFLACLRWTLGKPPRAGASHTVARKQRRR